MMLIVWFLLSLAHAHVMPEATSKAAAEARAFGIAGNAFALDLWPHLPPTGNLVFSPSSIYLALAMAQGGARGETAAEFARVLYSSPGPDLHRVASAQLASWAQSAENYTLNVANRVFSNQKGGATIHPSFAELTRAYYKSQAQAIPMDETGRATINGFVSKATKGMIPQLLPSGSIDSGTLLVIINAIFFHGLWETPFKPERTLNMAFQSSAGSLTGTAGTAMMMQQTGSFPYLQEDGLQMLELPYKGGHLSMVLLLPSAGRSLAPLEAQLSRSPAFLADRLDRLRGARVDIRLPRFKISGDVMPLTTPLQNLGLRRPFGPGADFGGMFDPSTTTGAFLSAVLHKAVVEVDETGTKAAAATAVTVMKTSFRPAPVHEFHADRPFLFLLRDLRSGTILFMGRVAELND